jgi:hypothetical protein
MRCPRYLGLLAIMLTMPIATHDARAQEETSLTSGQFWGDFRGTYRFSRITRLSGEIGYRTDISGDTDFTRFLSRWRFNWDVLDWMQLAPELFGDYTSLTGSSNTFELRPAIGVRFLVLWPTRRFRLDSYTRVEYRYFFAEDGANEDWWRFRTRLGGLIALNKATLLADRTLFAIVDAEPFISVDEGLSEEFADRLRLRLGLGYRHTYNWRFELIYTAQRARATSGEKFEVTDHIIRLRIKYFIN